MNEDGNTMNINDYNEWGYKNNKYISMIIMKEDGNTMNINE